MKEFLISIQDEKVLLKWLELIRPVTNLDIFLTIESIILNSIAKKKITDIEVNEIISLLSATKNDNHIDNTSTNYNEYKVRKRHFPEYTDRNRNLLIYQAELLRFKHYLERRFLKRQMILSHSNRKH